MSSSPFHRQVARIITWIAVAVALTITVSLPTVYFFFAYRSLDAIVQTEAEIHAQNVGLVVSSDPQMWRFRTNILTELLERRQSPFAQRRRLHDSKGNLLAENSTQLAPPILARTFPVFDAGQQVGEVESAISLLPLAIRTGGVLIAGSLLGAAGYVSLRVLPLRALDQAVTLLVQREQELNHLYLDLQQKAMLLEEQHKNALEAMRSKDNFLASMSHELRTPLNAIIGFSEMLHQGKIGEISPDQREALGDVLNSAKHLLGLINDVLDLVKIGAGRMEFHPEQVNLPGLIREVTDVMQPSAMEKGITVGVTIDPLLTDGMLDPSRFKQVLYNFLSNAIKFTARGGRVTVQARTEGPEHVRLEVHDTGIGIAPEDMKHLFIEFQQLDSGIARKYPGSGLGLALTKRIAEDQGGSVGVVSSLGQGSLFFAVLPRWYKPSSGVATKKSEATAHV